MLCTTTSIPGFSSFRTTPGSSPLIKGKCASRRARDGTVALANLRASWGQVQPPTTWNNGSVASIMDNPSNIIRCRSTNKILERWLIGDAFKDEMRAPRYRRHEGRSDGGRRS